MLLAEHGHQGNLRGVRRAEPSTITSGKLVIMRRPMVPSTEELCCAQSLSAYCDAARHMQIYS